MILVNGVAATSIPADDRGLAYGDGVFRTLLAVNGQPLHWARHYAKLAADCARLGIVCPAEPVLLAEACAVSHGQPQAAVKIIVTRGSGPRGYAPTEPAAPLRVVMASPLAAHDQPTMALGIHAHLCQIRLSLQPTLAGVKHLNRLENVLARGEWRNAEIREGLMLDPEGSAIGGTMSNLFIVENNALATPDLSRCGVAGVTRQRVIDWAQRVGVPCTIENLPLQRVLAADEVFFVNSLIGVWFVIRMDENHWPGAKLALAIGEALQSEN